MSNMPHFLLWRRASLPRAGPAMLPWNHTSLIKTRQSAKSTVALYPTFQAPCCEADCRPMKPEEFVIGPSNRAKQGEMGLQKPEFSGTTHNPGRNGHDSRAIGRNDHSLGTRQDASLSLCDSGGLSRGSSLVEKWIRVHMPGFWKPFELGGTHGTPYFPCESISFLVFFSN